MNINLQVLYNANIISLIIEARWVIQLQLESHSDCSCSILSIDFSFVDVVGIGGGFQDCGVGDRLAHPWLHTDSWLVYDTAVLSVSLPPQTTTKSRPEARTAYCVELETYFLHNDMNFPHFTTLLLLWSLHALV